ncbi:hypothetical protein [Lichenibacterium dinghuense]|uniref:hypothetical protein n=1 Tax=Lichenibacterium dinghuense TaxID=2895977 RepID=UPI001F3F78F7|nr:hypothetical protein [Lichenibacterium sp. 6Y81]
MKLSNPSIRSGAAHDLFRRHQRRLLPSETLADLHGDAVMAAIRAAEARKALGVFQAIAERDRAAGRPMSLLLGDRIRTARAALADAEAALGVAQSTVRIKRHAEVVDDDKGVN